MARWNHFSGYFWLFAPKFWEMVGTYEWLCCPKGNATSVVLTMGDGGDTQTLLDGNFFLTLCTRRQWGCKNFPIFPSSPALSLGLSLFVTIFFPLGGTIYLAEHSYFSWHENILTRDRKKIVTKSPARWEEKSPRTCGLLLPVVPTVCCIPLLKNCWQHDNSMQKSMSE